jgi:hypothetical protein
MGARRRAAQGMYNSIISSLKTKSDEEIDRNPRLHDRHSIDHGSRGMILAGLYYLACSRKSRPDFAIFKGRYMPVMAEEVRNSLSFALWGDSSCRGFK